jgi:hypothetical protein
MQRVNIVWRRLGKEHGEKQGLRLNGEDVVQEHIRTKLQQQRAHSDVDWRWWRIGEDILAERPLPGYGYGTNTTIYYLPSQDLCVVENIALPGKAAQYPYYIHIGETKYDATLDCWIFTDWFVDVLVAEDRRRFTVWDLDDFAEAFEKGLISGDNTRRILRSTAQAVCMVEEGRFPPVAILATKDSMLETQST